MRGAALEHATRVALALLLAAATPALADVRCPAALDGHRYARVSVFDGPPEEQADLVPDSQKGGTDTWRVGPVFSAGREPYLVCRYEGTPGTVTFRLAQPIAVCIASRPTRTALCR